MTFEKRPVSGATHRSKVIIFNTMMKHIPALIFVLLAANSFSQVQFIGFDRAVCPGPMVNMYTYSNYQSGGGGSGTIYGYTVYKNGVSVFDASGTLGDGKYGRDLIFINDSVGFLVYYSGNTSNRVLRTEDFGQTWSDIGGGAPTYYGLYVVNSGFAYLVTYWNTPLQLHVARCSNLAAYQNPQFIYDTSMNGDVFKTDTILNNDLCNIDSLQIYILSGVDTITYHINFNILVGIAGLSGTPATCAAYPNPARDNFSLSTTGRGIESVSLFSLNGLHVRTYDRQSIEKNTYSLLPIKSGIYLLKVTTNIGVFNTKLIVQ